MRLKTSISSWSHAEEKEGVLWDQPLEVDLRLVSGSTNDKGELDLSGGNKQTEIVDIVVENAPDNVDFGVWATDGRGHRTQLVAQSVLGGNFSVQMSLAYNPRLGSGGDRILKDFGGCSGQR